MITQYKLPVQQIMLFPNRNVLGVAARYGYFHIQLPQCFFYKLASSHFTLAFTSKASYATLLAIIKYKIKHASLVYMARLRIRGLGYRIRRFSPHLYRFYFTKTNFIYVHVPVSIIIRLRKRRIIILASHYPSLRSLLVGILLLKSTGPYNRRGFVYPRRMLFLKKGKKIT